VAIAHTFSIFRPHQAGLQPIHYPSGPDEESFNARQITTEPPLLPAASSGGRGELLASQTFCCDSDASQAPP